MCVGVVCVFYKNKKHVIIAETKREKNVGNGFVGIIILLFLQPSARNIVKRQYFIVVDAKYGWTLGKRCRFIWGVGTHELGWKSISNRHWYTGMYQVDWVPMAERLHLLCWNY